MQINTSKSQRYNLVTQNKNQTTKQLLIKENEEIV